MVALTFAARTYPVLPSDVDTSAPSAKAAIAYIGETLGLDTCGETANAYIKTLENGGSVEDAVAAATSLYRVNFFARGSTTQASAACKAAEAAYKSAFYDGRDPVTAAAEAYISASEADSPCASAAKAYFGAVNSGSNADSAALAASKAFASATAADARAVSCILILMTKRKYKHVIR